MRGLLPFLLLVTSLATAAPPPGRGEEKKPAPPKPLPGLRAPLGRIGDIVQPVQPGGVPATEQVVQVRFPGCGSDQQLAISRFLFLGAARAAEQIETWFSAAPEVKRQLFGPRGDPLAEAIGRARASTYLEGLPCDPKTHAQVQLATGGRIGAVQAPGASCRNEGSAKDGSGVWLFARKPPAAAGRVDFAAAVTLSPAVPEAKDRCRPRLSAALFDSRGRTRFAYHADYNGALEAVVYGERCQRLDFRFDAATQQFLPVLGKTPGCGKAQPRR